MPEDHTPPTRSFTWCRVCNQRFWWYRYSDDVFSRRCICDACHETDAGKPLPDEIDMVVELSVRQCHMSWEEAVLKVKVDNAKRAETLAKRQTTQSWSTIRRRIFKRDKGICQVCGLDCSEYWECGHIIDRMAGGTDLDDNLVVMCYYCNRLKPIHETKEEYDEWAAKGGPVTETINDLLAVCPDAHFDPVMVESLRKSRVHLGD